MRSNYFLLRDVRIEHIMQAIFKAQISCRITLRSQRLHHETDSDKHKQSQSNRLVHEPPFFDASWGRREIPSLLLAELDMAHDAPQETNTLRLFASVNRSNNLDSTRPQREIADCRAEDCDKAGDGDGYWKKLALAEQLTGWQK